MDSLDRAVRRTSRVFGWTFICSGFFFLSVPLWARSFRADELPFEIMIGGLFIALGAPFSGLPAEIRVLWRQLVLRRLTRTIERFLGGTAEVSEERTSVRWTGERHGKPVALSWILDAPWTQVSIQVPGGSPGTFRIIPTWTRGGWLIGGRTAPVGHAEIDRLFIARSEPAELLGRLFSAERRDRVAASLLSLPSGASGRVILTVSDLRIRLPRMFRRASYLVQLLDAADLLAEGLREAAREAGYAVLTVGTGTGTRCPICAFPLEEAIVLCLRCRTPHHEGCWAYTGECAIFACGGRRWVRPG